MIYHQPSGPTNYVAYNILRESVKMSQGKEQSSPKTKSTELSNHWFPREFWLHFWSRSPCPKITWSLGISLRTRLPEIIPNNLTLLSALLNVEVGTTLADPLLKPLNHIEPCRRETADRHQTHSLTITNHSHGHVLIL